MTPPAAPSSTPGRGLTASPDPTSGPRIKKFGATTTWADKSDVTVTPPQDIEIDGLRHAVLTITVRNNSPAPAPLEFWWIEATVGNEPAQALVDPGQGFGIPQGDLAPGASRSFRMAYPRQQGQKLSLRIIWRDGFAFTYQE